MEPPDAGMALPRGTVLADVGLGRGDVLNRFDAIRETVNSHESGGANPYLMLVDTDERNKSIVDGKVVLGHLTVKVYKYMGGQAWSNSAREAKDPNPHFTKSKL
jgi:hypothetical protein